MKSIIFVIMLVLLTLMIGVSCAHSETPTPTLTPVIMSGKVRAENKLRIELLDTNGETAEIKLIDYCPNAVKVELRVISTSDVEFEVLLGGEGSILHFKHGTRRFYCTKNAILNYKTKGGSGRLFIYWWS